MFACGLFTHVTPDHRTMPIVRRGNIAMLPDVPIETSSGCFANVHLIEMRSIGGVSGSPVFVRPTIDQSIPETFRGIKNSFSYGHGATLLGLVQGHWDVDEAAINEPRPVATGRRGVSMGIAIVVPAIKIIEAIDQPELRALWEEASNGTQATLPSGT